MSKDNLSLSLKICRGLLVCLHIQHVVPSSGEEILTSRYDAMDCHVDRSKLRIATDPYGLAGFEDASATICSYLTQTTH